MSEPCNHKGYCTPECEADPGHLVFDGRVANVLPGLCHCDRDLGGVPAHFTDPDQHFHRAISVERHERQDDE